MLHRNQTTKNTEARTTAKMTQLGRMFTYIELARLQYAVAHDCLGERAVCYSEMNDASKALVDELIKRGVVKLLHRNDKYYAIVENKALRLVDRYFAACADELRDGHFGKFTWSKRSKFHKALMQRIA